MILADKIIDERKKLGLSQEELAEKLSVSRQAVSKWESAQSAPDLQKIISMSELFSVSTDYLLKDDIMPNEAIPEESDYGRRLRRVSMEEACAFMSTMREKSKVVAFGVLLCILSPVLLIFLNGLAEASIGGVTETIACAVGLAALFIFIAAAVFLFIRYAGIIEKFNYLREETFETAYGVSGLVKEKKAAYEPIYTRFLSIGVILCVLSPLPLIITACFNEADVAVISMTSLLLCIVAIGVYMIVRVALVKTSYEVLLQEGEYTKAEKQHSKSLDIAGGAYWCTATAVYLAWSFLTNDWKSTWIIWPIAGVLFAPFTMLVKMFSTNNKNK